MDKLHKVYSTTLEPVVWARSVGVEVLNELDSVKAAMMMTAGSHRIRRTGREDQQVGLELAAKGVEVFAGGINTARTIGEGFVGILGSALTQVVKGATKNAGSRQPQ